MARALPLLLPEMSINEVVNVICIYSVPDPLPPETPLQHLYSFRSQHHTRSLAGLEIWSAPHWRFHLQ